MTTLNQAWINFCSTSFYAELGIDTPSLEGLSYHDLADHGVSPYKGDYIPTSFKGEVLAQINNRARTYVRQHQLNSQTLWDFDWLEQNHLLPFSEGVPDVDEGGNPTGEFTDYSKDYLLLDKEELRKFYKECIDFWWDHPLKEELFLVS